VRDGVVVVDAAVVAPDAHSPQRYLCITISNRRYGPPTVGTHDFFTPFRGTFEGTTALSGSGAAGAQAKRSPVVDSWSPIVASPEHTQRCHGIWRASRRHLVDRLSSPLLAAASDRVPSRCHSLDQQGHRTGWTVTVAGGLPSKGSGPGDGSRRGASAGGPGFSYAASGSHRDSVRLSEAVTTVVVPPLTASLFEGGGTLGGPSKHTTGLGLPLSRALAMCGGGWLGLEDEAEDEWECELQEQMLEQHHKQYRVQLQAQAQAQTRAQSSTHQSLSRALSQHLPSERRYQTRYWCVIETSLAVLSAADTVIRIER
jgi:hypothetical protein